MFFSAPRLLSYPFPHREEGRAGIPTRHSRKREFFEAEKERRPSLPTYKKTMRAQKGKRLKAPQQHRAGLTISE